jgi:hypothetical protein
MTDTPGTPRRLPPDPAGTQPRYDPDSLLPSTSEPLIPDDVVEADAVEEREDERGDLLPERRRPGAPVEAVAPAAHSSFAPRFQFLTGALVAIGVAAIVGLVALVVLPSTDGGGVQWSSWKPTQQGVAGGEQIAEHVAPGYKLPDGRQLVDVQVTPMEIQGLPLAVAVREGAAQGGDIRVFSDDGLIYHLCGLGPQCAIASGKPSTERHLLLSREALELALYSFRYLNDVHQVVVYMPPKLGERPSEALFFREGDVINQLQRPLNATLSPRVPSVRNVTLSPDATLVDQVTTPHIFRFSLTQANTDARAFLVLDPLDSVPAPSAGSSGSGAGASSGG